jgi:3-oxoacyl-[acyl-carrier protein] reductase
MPIPIDFSGKSVLITGGSQGIGEAMARRFHAAGATVIINFHGSTNTAADALRLTQDLSQRIDAIPADVSRPEEVEKMMETIRAKYGGLDFLVNNAAILRDRTIAKMSLDEWQSVIDVNLSGVFLLLQIRTPHHAGPRCHR